MAVNDDVSAAWHPALRPDDGEIPNAPLLNDSSPDSTDRAAEPVTDLNSEDPSSHNPDFPDADASIDAQQSVDPDLTDASTPYIEQDSSHLPTAQDSQDPDTGLPPTMADAPQENIISDKVAPLEPVDGNVNGSHNQTDTHIDPAPQTPVQPFWAEDNNAQSNGDEDPTAWLHTHNDREANLPVNGYTGNNSRELWGSPTTGDAEDGFFNQLKTQTKPIWSPPEVESRYEEGLPLLDALDSPIGSPTKEESQIDKIFEGDGDEEGEDFFSGVQKSAPAADTDSSFHITRKSTSQVIASLDVAPDSPASDASPTAQEFSNVLAAAASETQDKDDLSDDDLAARWQAELEDDQPEKAPEDDLAARWQAALDDDDDLFLEDEISDGKDLNQAGHAQNNQVAQEAAPPTLSSPFGTPQSSARSQMQPTTYTPHQPSTSDLLQGIPGIAPQPSGPPAQNYFTSPPQSRPTATRAESFAERSKEGYKSPYDLPEDLARPRRAAAPKPVGAQPGNVPPPPPRGTSIPGPPQVSATPPPPPAASAGTSAPAPKNFYEELPLPPPRPRSRPASTGRYTPNPNVVTSPPSHVQPPPANPYASLSPPMQDGGDVNLPSQVQQSEQLDPYASLMGSSGQGAPPAVPSAASRYSPKPPTLHPGTKPPSAPRYSPAPPQSTAPPPPRNRYASQPPSLSGPAVALPFQPRTSSPLAYHEKVSYQPPGGPVSQPPTQPVNNYVPGTAGPYINEQETTPVGGAEPAVPELNTQDVPMPPQPTSPPRNPYAPPAYINEFSKRVAPMASPPPVLTPPTVDSQYLPPRRSQTQSPSQQNPNPGLSVPSIDPLQRPASVHDPSSPTKAVNPYAPSQISIHNRAPSQPLEFIPPNDGQESDPLQRWKGAPIVSFGFGGSITACFPKHVPRYTAGQVAPKIKSTPGEVKICQFNDWVPTTESIVQHPGPLKGKSKKKDLLAWLSSKIVAFENEGIPESLQLHPDSYKRHDEKVLLWKIVRILVEHDGVLEGSTEVEKSIRSLIFPHMQNTEPDSASGAPLPGLNPLPSLDSPSRSDSTEYKSIEGIRNNLLVGNREKAVWDAVDHRLWGHAMIIASTLDRSVWKQVVQEFVRREVRSTTSNSESIAALYEIFAGNIDESVDELVPPSARAGFQMVSKVGGQESSKNALEGLNSWRDTLGLVLNNRSPDDCKALLALGRLLLSYGRTEAAHICFIFSRAAVFGGADDPQTSIVLLGADHQHLPANVLQDDDAILLTEAYEYALSVLAASPIPQMPHLLAFKLIHAWSLADRGRKAEALQYTDAVTAALKATTKPSAYHHQHLFYGVDELSARLRQTATDGGSSWISRPSMEKMSGSMWAKFNSFVAGEDSDAASTVSGKAGDGDVGPFAKIAGTPTVSRSPSVTDFGPYSMPAATTQPMAGSGPSRYQPNNQYVPTTSSPEQFRGRSSLDSQRSSSYGHPVGQRRGSQEPSTPIESNMYQGGPFYGSPSAVGYQSTPPQTSYIPLAPVEEDSAAQSYSAGPIPTPGSPMNVAPYQPPMGDSFGQPLGQSTTSAPDPATSGYMPPGVSGGGYEPPSVEISTVSAPEPTEEEPSGQESLKKMKSFMDDDDDDDIAARSAAIQKAEKARKDREADEAFRKAAEADAKKPATSAKKSSWFGGWFGGAKKESDNLSGGPIRAKLGEENSFYYDKELKKWVNKKDPSSASVSRGTPPPPKGLAPPSRTASGSSMPPPPGPSHAASGSDSRPSSSAGVPPSLSHSPAPPSLSAPPPMLGTTRSVSTGAAMPTPPGSSLGPPPPRPATSLSNASSIDDLLGAPQVRKGPAAKGKKKGRYVDVMAK